MTCLVIVGTSDAGMMYTASEREALSGSPLKVTVASLAMPRLGI